MQGRSDTDLAASGRRQAVESLGLLPAFSKIISSPLKRARQTAEIIADHQRIPLEVDERLVERSWGEWEGFTATEVEKRWPGLVASGDLPAGFEDNEAILARCSSLLRDALREGPFPLLMVTHGGLMRAVTQHYRGPVPGFKNLDGQWINSAAGELKLGERIQFISDGRSLDR